MIKFGGRYSIIPNIVLWTYKKHYNFTKSLNLDGHTTLLQDLVQVELGTDIMDWLIQLPVAVSQSEVREKTVSLTSGLTGFVAEVGLMCHLFRRYRFPDCVLVTYDLEELCCCTITAGVHLLLWRMTVGSPR